MFCVCVCVCVRTENESFAVAVSEAARWKRIKNVSLSLTIQNREIRTGRYKIVILSFFLIKSEILNINHIKQMFKVLYVECYNVIGLNIHAVTRVNTLCPLWYTFLNIM